MAKELHWGGKVYPLRTCATCMAEQVPVQPDNIMKKVGQQNMLMIPKGVCRGCVDAIEKAVQKVGTEMAAARAGGEYK